MADFIGKIGERHAVSAGVVAIAWTLHLSLIHICLSRPEWLDTVNVPVEGSVDLMMDFTDPIIRGVSLFHCHLLSHEDKGMMAKILFK